MIRKLSVSPKIEPECERGDRVGVWTLRRDTECGCRKELGVFALYAGIDITKAAGKTLCFEGRW